MPRELTPTRSYSSFQTKDGKPWDPCDNGILPIADALDSFQSGWPPKTSKELERAIHGKGQLATLEHWLESFETPSHAAKFRKTVLKPVRLLEVLEEKFHPTGCRWFAELDGLIEIEENFVRSGDGNEQLKYLIDKKVELCEEYTDICDAANEAAIYCRNKAVLVRKKCDENPSNIAARERWEKAQLDDEPQHLTILASRCGGRDLNFGSTLRLTALSRDILRAAEFAMDEGTLKGITRERQSSRVRYDYSGAGGRYFYKGKSLGDTLRRNRVPAGIEQTTEIERYCRPSVFFAWAHSRGFPVPEDWEKIGQANEQEAAVREINQSDQHDIFAPLSGLVTRFGILKSRTKAFEKALERWRDKNLLGTNWIRHDARAKNEPAFHYRVTAVADLAKKYTNTKPRNVGRNVGRDKAR